MKIFTLSKSYNIVCNTKNTRNGFKHTATLCKNGISIYNTKICYLNRTWESFEYHSILKKTIEANFEGKEKERYLKKVKDEGEGKSKEAFKSVVGVCAIGNILCKTQKEKNKWKKKMLGTIHGINFPEDFDQLPEEEKKKRLDKAIESIT